MARRLDLQSAAKLKMQTFEENDSIKEVMELFTGILSKMYEEKETGIEKKYPDAETYLDTIR
jgi:hypothetical protein